MLTASFIANARLPKRSPAQRALAHSAGEAIEQTHQVYGVRLLVRGLLWVSIYLLSRGLLELTIADAADCAW